MLNKKVSYKLILIDKLDRYSIFTSLKYIRYQCIESSMFVLFTTLLGTSYFLEKLSIKHYN